MTEDKFKVTSEKVARAVEAANQAAKEVNEATRDRYVSAEETAQMIKDSLKNKLG